MAEAIYLEDSLAARLRARASVRNESTEQLVHCVLTSELDRFDSSEEWRALNSRRLALIRKRTETGLTLAEEADLRAYQLAADHWLEAYDNHLLTSVRHLEEAVRRLPPK